jgi:DNA-nicking Smr family endonuclease
MNFGDILDAWDKETAKAAGKKALHGGMKKIEDAAGEPEDSPRVDPLTAWMRVNGVEDKDAEDPAAERFAGERRRRLLNKRPDAVLDLHGLNKDDAWTALESFFNDARRQGFEKVLVIHGKGNHSEGEAALKRVVRDYTERCPFAGECGHGNAASGGSGATWVLLKNQSGLTGEG